VTLVHCQEEDHEWGGPGTASALANKPVSMATLANAARRWRISLQQKREVDRRFLHHLCHVKTVENAVFFYDIKLILLIYSWFGVMYELILLLVIKLIVQFFHVAPGHMAP